MSDIQSKPTKITLKQSLKKGQKGQHRSIDIPYALRKNTSVSSNQNFEQILTGN
ncbi:hypothetical protein [Kiloniella sp.]|uniref:hypothetical protein n=1 Tax=Kiloniella sp. TaxID=1938587 RepID=UPI003B010C69